LANSLAGFLGLRGRDGGAAQDEGGEVAEQTFHPAPGGNSDYRTHTGEEISTTPKAPCEPTSEIEFSLGAEQTSARTDCGTLSDDAGALPIKIAMAMVAMIVVVRMSRPELSAPDLLPKGEEVVNTYTAVQPRRCCAFAFDFNHKRLG
jgi:hypothetical protein